MTAQHDMEDLASSDLDRAHESLYYAARRYCVITEKGFVQNASNLTAEHDPSFITIGGAAAELAETGQRYVEAYARWVSFLPRGADDGPPAS